MASLPKECRAVLGAPAPVSEAAVTIGGNGAALAAAPARPVERAATAAASIDPAAPPIAASAYAPTPDLRIPLPRPRPSN
jgi:penicillin-insensitive murein endopeptidase